MPIFKTTSEILLLIFLLDCDVSNKNLPFYFFVSSKNQTSCTGFLKLELAIYVIIPDVSLKFCPAFQKTEAAFGRCSTKVVSCSAKLCNEI